VQPLGQAGGDLVLAEIGRRQFERGAGHQDGIIEGDARARHIATVVRIPGRTLVDLPQHLLGFLQPDGAEVVEHAPGNALILAGPGGLHLRQQLPPVLRGRRRPGHVGPLIFLAAPHAYTQPRSRQPAATRSMATTYAASRMYSLRLAANRLMEW